MSMPQVEASRTSGGFPAPRVAWTAVAVLCIVTTCAFVDRQLVSLLIEPMGRTLGLGDTQLSLIQSLAFVLFYTLMGVPLGQLVDRHNRRNLIVLGIVVWSVMTVLGGFADGFWSLFVTRAGVGVGEALLAPAAYSLLADTFEPSRRGRAIALVALSATIGSGGSFLIGGLVLGAVPGEAVIHLPLLGDRYGWQIAFMAAGAPGLLIAALMFAVREPDRQERALHGHGSDARGLVGPYVRRYGRLLLGAFIVSGLTIMIGYGTAAWMATYFIRRFELAPSTVGYALGALSILAALTGGWVGGTVSDRLAERRTGGRFDMYVICAVVALPLLATWSFAPTPVLGFVLLFGVIAALNLASCTTPTILQEIAPNELRGQVLGSYAVVQGILGPGLGPISIALVTDFVLRDPAAIGLSLPLVTVPLAVATLVLALALRRAYGAARAEVLEVSRDTEGKSALRTHDAKVTLRSEAVGRSG